MHTTKTTIARFALAPALVCAALLPLANVANAGEAREPIVVHSSAELRDWQEEQTSAINRALSRNHSIYSRAMPSGIVQVSFKMGENGRPAELRAVSNSASRDGRRAAFRAVRSLGNISDVPVDNAQNAKFMANIVFASNRREYRELAAQLEQSERARLAKGRDAEETIVLGG